MSPMISQPRKPPTLAARFSILVHSPTGTDCTEDQILRRAVQRAAGATTERGRRLRAIAGVVGLPATRRALTKAGATAPRSALVVQSAHKSY